MNPIITKYSRIFINTWFKSCNVFGTSTNNSVNKFFPLCNITVRDVSGSNNLGAAFRYGTKGSLKAVREEEMVLRWSLGLFVLFIENITMLFCLGGDAIIGSGPLPASGSRTKRMLCSIFGSVSSSTGASVSCSCWGTVKTKTFRRLLERRKGYRHVSPLSLCTWLQIRNNTSVSKSFVCHRKTFSSRISTTKIIVSASGDFYITCLSRR